MLNKLTKLINLQSILEENEDWQSPTHYLITESFPVNGIRQYELYNLTCEISDGMIMFHDAEEFLQEDCTRVLNMFPISSVSKVNILENHYVIVFDTGDIKIEIIE